MLTNLQLFSPNGAAPEVPLHEQGIEFDSLHIREVTGLGPVKGTVVTTPNAARTGESFRHTSVGKRNIVLKVGLNPNWDGNQTFSKLRQTAYTYFMTAMPIKLRFTSTNRELVEIDGVVESVEPSIFSRDPEMTVSIICAEPDFLGISEAGHLGQTINGSGSEALPSTLNYSGNVATGFVLRVSGLAPNTSYSGPIQFITTTPVAQTFGISFVTISPGTVFELSTLHGNKRAHTVQLSTGNILNVLQFTDAHVDWPQLHPGTYDASIIAEGKRLNWEIKYFRRYGAL